MAQPNYKLTYFNVRARAEPIRFIFALAKVPYEDVRILKENWPNLKNQFTWGQLPILEENGKVLAQSIAITRYLGRKYKLVGENEFEAAKCDELVDALMDSRVEWKKTFFEPDPAKKESMKKELLEVHFAKYLTKFEEIAKSSGTKFLVGNQVTWADLTIAHTLEFYEDTIEPKLLDNYPQLRQFKETVYAIPEIKDWLERRPKTPM